MVVSGCGVSWVGCVYSGLVVYQGVMWWLMVVVCWASGRGGFFWRLVLLVVLIALRVLIGAANKSDVGLFPRTHAIIYEPSLEVVRLLSVEI